MHYGLVKWLAYKAGFSLLDAETVAAGSQSADESSVLDATEVMINTGCRGIEASRHVQQNHFPSGGYVPSQPSYRVVVPGRYDIENNENRWVRQEILVSGVAIDRRTRLDRFGASLHPLADSWAHQGKSDTVLICPDDLFWGHPANRGGISLPYGKHNHDADLTYMFPADAIDAAETLYEFMIKFLNKNVNFQDHSYEEWTNLRDDVDNFAKAEMVYAEQNDTTKQAWFERHTEVWGTYTTYPCFLESLNLEGAENSTCSTTTGNESDVETTVLAGSLPSIDADVPDGVRGVVEQFLTTWIVEKDFTNAVNNFLAKDEVAIRLAEPVFKSINSAIEPFQNQKDVDEIIQALSRATSNSDDWMNAILGMWFVADHGLVNKLGHGMPNNVGFLSLATGNIERQIRFNSLTDAIHIPGQRNTYLLISIGPSGRGERYLTTFAFRHAPRDAIMLMVEQIDGDWKISGFFWLIA